MAVYWIVPAVHGEFDNSNPEHQLYHELFVQAVEDLTHGGDYDDSSPLTYDQEIAEVAGAEYTDGTAFQHRVEGNLRVRSAHRQGAVED